MKWRIDVLQQGLKLRARGMTYQSISIALSEYHDFNVTPAAVRTQLRKHGAMRMSPRGHAFGSPDDPRKVLA